MKQTRKERKKKERKTERKKERKERNKETKKEGEKERKKEGRFTALRQTLADRPTIIRETHLYRKTDGERKTNKRLRQRQGGA